MDPSAINLDYLPSGNEGAEKAGKAFDKGLEQGKGEIERIVGDPKKYGDVMNQIFQDQLNRYRAGASGTDVRALQAQYGGASKQLAGQQASSGMRGAAAGKQRAELGMQYALNRRSLDTNIRRLAEKDLEASASQKVVFAEQLPLAYAAYRSGAATSAQMAQAANKPYPEQDSGGGLISGIFDGIGL